MASSFEDHKAMITELYAKNTLPVVKRVMLQNYCFKGTENQWKKQIKKWGLDKKNFKYKEYEIISGKKRKRKEESDKDTRFVLHGREVPPEKIRRWEERNAKKQDASAKGDPKTPEGLNYFTPKASPKVAYMEEVVDEHFARKTRPELNDSTLPLIRSPSVTSFDWLDTFVRFSESPRNISIHLPGNTIPFLKYLLDFAKPIDHYEKECEFKKFVEVKSTKHECENCRLRSTMDSCERYFARELDYDWIREHRDENYYERLSCFASAAVHRVTQIWLKRTDLSIDERVFGLALSVSRFLLSQEANDKAKDLLEAVLLEMDRTGSVGFREYARITLARCNLMLGNFPQAEKFLGEIFKSGFESVFSGSKNPIFTYIDSNLYCERHRHGMVVYVEARSSKEVEYIYRRTNHNGKSITVFPFRLRAIHFEQGYHHRSWEENLWPSVIKSSMNDHDDRGRAEDDHWDWDEDEDEEERQTEVEKDIIPNLPNLEDHSKH